MIKSMTAYGRSRQSIEGADITVEIKSVNSKYLDLSIKVPRQYSFLEDKIRTYIGTRGIVRGKVEIYVGIDTFSSDIDSILIDKEYAQAYIDALKDLQSAFSLKDDITTMSVAQNRELFNVKKSERSTDDTWNMILPTLDCAIDAFLEARINEGARIEADIRKKIENIKALSKEIAPLSIADTEAKYEKLKERIKKIVGDNNIAIDEQRLLTECAIFADKIAVDEELVRLSSHFKTFEEILSKDTAVGRNIDFLLQEINRETNTIGSKCNNADAARIVVSIKCEIEKVREQIQNIE